MFAPAQAKSSPPMLLRRPVKAAAVASLTDARYFAALGVEYLGFALEPGGIPLAEAIAVREWVSGPQIVAECGGLPLDDVVELCRALRPDAVQVGPFAAVGQVAEATALPVLQAIPLDAGLTPDLVDAQRTAAPPAALVVDATGVAGGWSGLRQNATWLPWLREVSAELPVLLELTATAEELEAILAELPEVGLQVRGGDEEAVGVKSFAELDAWFERLEVE